MTSKKMVTPIKDDKDFQDKLKDPQKPLVVLVFVKPGSGLYKYMQSELQNIAEAKQNEAVFYELDVNKFKSYATRFHVEALPAFIVMQGFVKKRHVVGIDDLKKAIEDVYKKIEAKKLQDAGDSSRNNQNPPDSSTPTTKEAGGNSQAKQLDSTPKSTDVNDDSRQNPPDDSNSQQKQPDAQATDTVSKAQSPATARTNAPGPRVSKQSSECYIL